MECPAIEWLPVRQDYRLRVSLLKPKHRLNGTGLQAMDEPNWGFRLF